MDERTAKEFLHIENWLDRATEIVAKGEQLYRSDALLQEAGDSIMMKLGEAARRITGMEIQAPVGVDWSLAVANRNFIIHQYDEISRALTWQTLAVDLPKWRQLLDPLISKSYLTLGLDR